MTSTHPWRQLRELVEWTLEFAPLPGRQRGRCHWASRTITLRPGLTQAARRSVLQHELIHVERGPTAEPYQEAEERFVDRETARRLIGIRELGEALAWSSNVHEVAEELWTTIKLVRIRLAHLHPAERHYLNRRLNTTDGDSA